MNGIAGQLVRAYAEERFEVPAAALPGLARRRRHRVAAACTTAVVLALAASAGIALRPAETAPVDPAGQGPPAVAPDLDAVDFLVPVPPDTSPDCLDFVRSMYRDFAWFEPDVTFHFAHETASATVLINERAAVACQHVAPADEPSRFFPNWRSGAPPPDPGWVDGARLEYFSSSEGARRLLFGAVPAGTERVEVRLVDGTIVAAVLSNGWFAVWFPSQVAGVHRVVAYTSDDVYERSRTNLTVRTRKAGE